MLYPIGFTFLFGLSAHAYRFFSTAFSHDSTYLYQSLTSWQISIGRFMQPVYLMLRGELCAPFLIGLLSLAWLAGGTYLVVTLLDIRSKVLIALICGVLSTNVVLSLAFATYLPWCDVFTLSFFLSALSVYLQRRFRFGFLFGAIPLVFSLALYQSYLETAVFLSLILLVKDCFDHLSAKEILFRMLKAFGLLLAGLVGYFFCLKIVLFATHIELSTAANGISEVGNYSGVSILRLIVKTYLYPFEYYLNPSTYHPILAALLNIAIILSSVFLIFKISFSKKLSRQSNLFLSLFLLAIPFGMNIVFFITKGFKHDLMSYSFCLLFVFALFLQQYDQESQSELKTEIRTKKMDLLKSITRIAVVVSVGIIIFNNIIYANHLYLKKQLEYETTIATLTRVVDRIEQTDVYIVGQTPVAIIGSLNDSQLASARPGFEYIDSLGMEGEYSVTYLETYGQFFQNILGYPIDLIQDPGQIEQLAKISEVRAMPSFPSKGCCVMIGNVLILKLS